MVGHTPEWHLAKKDRDARIKLIFGNKDDDKKKGAVDAVEVPIAEVEST